MTAKKADTNDNIVVAVDGPSASGKSTVSRRLAEKLDFTYCDSGSLYRAVTWKALRENLNLSQSETVIAMLSGIKWNFFAAQKGVEFTIDGVDPGNAIRSAEVADNVSAVASIPEVRQFIVERLREMLRFGNLVMEGRDIGTVVFPSARFKYYLNASPEERARRRHEEYKQQNQENGIDKVYLSLKKRDATDSSRKTAPLQIAPDAVVVDSTSLGIEEVVQFILVDLQAKREESK